MDDGLKRIIRLVGDGRDEMSGGGLPLPDAFAAVLQYLLDSGPALQEVLTKKVMEALSFKEMRVLAIWGSWEFFTDDIICQLGVRKLIHPGKWDDRRELWSIADDFRQGESYEVISEKEISKATGGRARSPITVTAYDAETREARNEAAKLVMTLNGWAKKVQRAGRMTSAIEMHVAGITAELEGREDPTKLPDEPGKIVICPGCSKKKAKTHKNFSDYLSRGEYYWRVNCIDCSMTVKSREFQDALISAVEELTVDDVLPRVAEVHEKMGRGTLKTVEQSWDRLAKRDKLPWRQ